MEIANSTVRLEDADSITGLAIAVRALHAEHPSSSGLARGIGGTVWIGELARRRAKFPTARRFAVITTPIAPKPLRLHAAGDQQAGQRQQRQTS